ncbi:Spo0B domain-containing protein [Paenibacillus terrigena]|uniref:Spo0B domain-containing protein n=1 Tax=Paenibacillus terrigena TaxID=369333 RepID=UPI0012EC2837|nr:Spo0B domain-containing protein [Paenibacillus terrigena]
MNYWRTMRMTAMVSLVIPLFIVVIIQQWLVWSVLLLILWLIIAGLVMEWSVRKEQAEVIRAEQVKSIRTMNHHRHDWMNDLQIISGYIQLKKHDKLVRSVERIRDRMHAESKVAKLGIPTLVLFFQSFRTTCNEIQLEIDIVDELNLAEIPLTVPPETLSRVVQEMVWATRQCAVPTIGEPQILYIMFEKNNNECCVSFRYHGEIRQDSDWGSKVKSVIQGSTMRVEQDEATLHLFVPCES